METSGPESEVVKLLPPLTTTADELAQGLDDHRAVGRRGPVLRPPSS